MTLPRISGIALAFALLLPAAAGAQQRTPRATPPPPRVSYEDMSRQQQVSDQLRKNQLEERLHQGTAEAIRRPQAGDPAQSRLLDQAEQARRDRYRERQQDVIDTYRDAVRPQRTRPVPAHSSSG